MLLADDHAMIREGLRALLEKQGFDVVAEARNGQQAEQLACEMQPDVAILDLGMPVLNGIEAGRALRGSCPALRTVALTIHTEEHYVLAALEAGFRGYVVKSQASSELLEAIAEVTKGSIYLSPLVSATVVDGYLGRAQLPRDPLSRREQEVLHLVAEGKSTKEIADTLGISPRTAESHRKHLKTKLAIRDTAGLVRYAIRRGLVRA